ncbi:MBL fold metallo-hydrolase [Microlunatus soli]|uniref:Glyoxylase, beta-lactamase superfamily II n=1 Tax=Microlunatus soli TaxID=630515 RepID=A0A1H1T1A2_9ACTN|nr:MBL fold metallo-hydrolase [Microlunatus soli]SDS54045.1 Glyoxylase, beta-lactamase superfamily II [Microlunatus soli]
MNDELIAPGVQRVLAPNPGPMTLDGTNTWVLGDVAHQAPVVVDPGPLDEDHLRRVLEASGLRISAIWITHRHHDHTDGARRLAELASCPVMAVDPEVATGRDQVLSDGHRTVVGDLEIVAIATPGHTSDSASFLVRSPAGPALLLTGDMVLGRGTTVITYPDGDLGAYLESLELMIKLVDDHQVVEILPGHGDRVRDPGSVLRYYRKHRQQRLDQVRRALADGARSAAEVVRIVYADVDPAVWPAAEQSVRAQLDYLNS